MEVVSYHTNEKICIAVCSIVASTSFAHAVHQTPDTAAILYIPVVFHVVSNGASGHVTDQQIFEQLNVINEDFSGSNPDRASIIEPFHSSASNSKIQFFMAFDQNALGITRTSTLHGKFANDDLHRSARGGADAWDASAYLNIWVADLAGGILGYGSSPGTEAFKDGVAIHYEYFGRMGAAKSPYNLGRTATHEIGHWLGLDHPWGKGDCFSNDGLLDTPAQDRPAAGCDLSFQSCGVVAMTQNFMNSSFDACLTMFTQQQTALMRKTLFAIRSANYSMSPPPLITTTNELETDIQVYPNPVSGKKEVSIEHDQHFVFHGLFDITGKPAQPLAVQNSDGKTHLDLSALPAGVYFLKFSNVKTHTYRKIMIE